MIKIAISQAAFEAIAATLPLGSVNYENKTNERGERYVWLAPAVIDRLRAMRGPDESYSDVIPRHSADSGHHRRAAMTTNPMPRAKTERLIVREIDGETVVYDRSRAAASCLNEFAARVWRACDGERSVAAIAAALGEDERAVWLALHQLTKAQLLTEAVAFPPDMSAAKSRREIGARLGVGAAAFVASIVAPMPAQAASCKTLGEGCVALSPGLLGNCCPDMDLLCSGVVGFCRHPS